MLLLKSQIPLMPDPLLSLSPVSEGSKNQIEHIMKNRPGQENQVFMIPSEGSSRQLMPSKTLE